MNCGYLNPDKTCNSTLLCKERMCEVINSNYFNVKQKAERLIQTGKELLKDMEEERTKLFSKSD